MRVSQTCGQNMLCCLVHRTFAAAFPFAFAVGFGAASDLGAARALPLAFGPALPPTAAMAASISWLEGMVLAAGVKLGGGGSPKLEAESSLRVRSARSGIRLNRHMMTPHEKHKSHKNH